MSGLTKYKPGSMSFGQALLTGVGVTVGFLGAAIALHFAGDIYQGTKRWLLKNPTNGTQIPPTNGATVSGLWPLYRR